MRDDELQKVPKKETRKETLKILNLNEKRDETTRSIVMKIVNIFGAT